MVGLIFLVVLAVLNLCFHILICLVMLRRQYIHHEELPNNMVLYHIVSHTSSGKVYHRKDSLGLDLEHNIFQERGKW